MRRYLGAVLVAGTHSTALLGTAPMGPGQVCISASTLLVTKVVTQMVKILSDSRTSDTLVEYDEVPNLEPAFHES